MSSISNSRFILLIAGCSVVLSGCTVFESKVKSGLQVVTNDTKASLFLNEQYLDKTPYIDKNIKPGTYTLKIDPEDKSLAPLETSLTLNKGTLTVVTWNPGKTPETSGGVTYELQPHSDPKTAEVEFHTVPDTAIITFDNQEQTFSPLTISKVEPGNHEFEIKLPSYQTQKHTMNAVAGKKLVITIKLAKQVAGTASLTADRTKSASNSSETNKSASDSSKKTSSGSADLSPTSLSDKIAKNLAVPTATDSVTIGSRIKIQPTNYFQNEKEVLRIRENSDAASKEIGLVLAGNEYRYLKNHTNGFYQIQFGQKQTGWVSDKFAQITEP
jgi:hypothetical protein